MTWAVCFWAVVYKPFGAQSIGIYKMTMMMINGFMMVDEMYDDGDLISGHTSLEKTHRWPRRSPHTEVFVAWKVLYSVDWAVIVAV